MDSRGELSHSHPLRTCASGCPVFCRAGPISLSAPPGVCRALSGRAVMRLADHAEGVCCAALGLRFLCRCPRGLDSDSAAGPVRSLVASCAAANGSGVLDRLRTASFFHHGHRRKARPPLDLARRIVCASGSWDFSIHVSRCASAPRLDFGTLP